MEPRVLVLCHRHGARGPSIGAVKQLNEFPLREWRRDEIDALSDIGSEQMHKLGAFFRLNYLTAKFVAVARRKWRSSKSKRVLLSGKWFWEGFCDPGKEDDGDATEASETLSAPPTEPLAYTDDADLHFRPWAVNETYLEVANRRRSELSLVRPEPSKEAFVERMRSAIGLSGERSDIINCFSYIKEVMECEKFDFGNGDEQRRAVHDLHRSEIELQLTTSLAKFVWSQRFFIDAHMSEIIGGVLLREILSDLASSEPLFAVYSSHDYTLLSLLAKLGYREYPGEILSYGACMLFEAYVQNDGEVLVKMYVVAHPFEDSSHSAHHEVLWDEKSKMFIETPLIGNGGENRLFSLTELSEKMAPQ